MTGYRVLGGGGGGAPSGPAGFTDSFSIALTFPDTNTVPTDAASYAMTLAQSDSNAGHSDSVELKFPAGVYVDSSTAPSDVKDFAVRVWLSGSSGAGVTNPTNADGQNNGTNATVSTAPLGSNTETLTSLVGVNLPAGLSVASAVYRGWFALTVSLGTSTGRVIAHSSTALFADVTMFTSNSTTSHATGTFTFDLVAAGIDTSAKLQSLEIYHQTQDAVAGVTPAVMSVDAGSIELGAAF